MRKILAIAALLITLNLPAQEKQEISEADYQNTKVEMADRFREDGKIYVVVAVMSILLTGLLIYTVIIDRKVSRIEKSLEKEVN